MSTVRRWVKRYREKGLASLADAKVRSDKGKSRRLPAEAVTLIEGLALQTPPRSIAAIHRQVCTLAGERGWKVRVAINGGAAVVSFAVVVIFAVTKFFEGAWIVLVLFPVLVFVLIRLNQRYREEAAVLGETAAAAAAEASPLRRQVVLIMIDRLDLVESASAL